jgi:hypothetical protein
LGSPQGLPEVVGCSPLQFAKGQQAIQDRWCALGHLIGELQGSTPTQMAIPLLMDAYPNNSWSLQERRAAGATRKHI